MSIEVVNPPVVSPLGERKRLVSLLSWHLDCRWVTHPGLEAEAGPPVPSLAQPATEAKRTFASFFRQKEDPSPRLPGEQKYRRSNAKAPSSAGLLKVVPWWRPQGRYLGGARAEALGLAYFAREAKYQNSWGSMAAGPNWQGCGRALDLANWVSDQVRNGYRPSSRADSKDLLGGRSFSRSSVGHWLPPSGDLL